MQRFSADRALLIGASLFASWTLYCYLLVLSGAGFHTLMTFSMAPVVGGLLLAHAASRGNAAHAYRSMPATATTPPSTAAPACPWLLATLAMATAVLFHGGAPYLLVWTLLLGTALLVFHMVRTAATAGDTPCAPSSRRARGAVIAIATCCAVLTAVMHRPDIDDSQYLNFAVTALDFPVEPLFSRSGLWADHSVPLELPLYRFHSYELLIAALSSATGVDHKVFYYLLFPPLCAALAVVVHWRLARYLSPHHALPLLLGWVVLLIALGESHRTFGNFAFVRLYQGKSVLLTCALPYCLLMALQFAEAPTRRGALALGVAVLASLGLSSSALATVPVAIAAALIGGMVNASGRELRNIVAGGLASCVVLVGIALYVMTTMNLGNGNYGSDAPSTGTGLVMVLGPGWAGSLVLALFPLAPLFVQRHQRRRMYAAMTVFFIAFVLNPWAAPFAARLFDLALQWRLFWPVPLLASAALSLAALAALARQRLPRAAQHVALPVVLLLPLLLSSRWSSSPDNNVTYAWPRFKVDALQHELAAQIVRQAPPRATVYAPTAISAWLATFRQHPYAVSFRPDYLYFGRVKQRVGHAEIERRLRIIRILEGTDTQAYAREFFEQQVIVDRPSIVVYPQHILLAGAIGSFLGRNGYVGVQHDQYWLWQRP